MANIYLTSPLASPSDILIFAGQPIIALQATVASGTTVTANISGQIPLGSSSLSVTSVTSSLTMADALSASVVSESTLSAEISVGIALVSTIGSSTTYSNALTIGDNPSFLVSSTSSLEASLNLSVALTARIDSSTAVDLYLGQVQPLSASIISHSLMMDGLGRFHFLDSSISSSSSLSLMPSGKFNLTTSISSVTLMTEPMGVADQCMSVILSTTTVQVAMIVNHSLVSGIVASTSMGASVIRVPAVPLPTNGYAGVSVNLPKFKQFIPDQRRWETTQERMRQVDSLYRMGEFAAFCLMWTTEDFHSGLVKRCPTCQEASSLITSTYTQPSFDRCPTCFGHLYAGAHGGIKAFLIRPSAWTYTEGDNRFLPRGEVESITANITTPYDIRLYNRDYVLRGDGQRFGVTSIQGLHLANGFGTSSHTTEAVGYSYTVARENESSPAWMIGLLTPELISLLDVSYRRNVPDFTQWEFIDGPVSV